MSVMNSSIQPDSLSNIISRSPLMRMVAPSAARSPCERRKGDQVTCDAWQAS